MHELETRLSRLIIETLNLEELTIDEIDPVAPLFGEGLGLDSIDALEIGVAIRKTFGIKIDSNDQNLREHFASVRNLAAFINMQRNV